MRDRVELPKYLNEEINRYFFESKKKGKNEFLFHAIKEYAQKKGIKWSGKQAGQMVCPHFVRTIFKSRVN